MQLRLISLSICFVTAALVAGFGQDQGPMFMTSRGFLAISAPEGFEQVQGPMEVLFVPAGKEFGKTDEFIYVATVAIGQGTQFKNLDAFIQFDVREFKKRFSAGVAKEETPVALPQRNGKAPVWTFQSGERKNGFERLVFIQDNARLVWLLVLSASTQDAFDRGLPVFSKWVQSYKGSLMVGK